MTVYTRNNYNKEAGYYENNEPSMTKQSHKKECDINNIMAKYQKTGLCDHIARYEPNYQDVPSIDYKDAMDKIIEIDTIFGELPSTVRKQFENDPYQFVQFVENPDNIDALREMGLCKPAQGVETTPEVGEPTPTPENPSDGN